MDTLSKPHRYAEDVIAPFDLTQIIEGEEIATPSPFGKHEDEAVTHAKYDLDQAANQKQLTGSDSAFAESLKSRGYRSVDGFKIVR